MWTFENQGHLSVWKGKSWCTQRGRSCDNKAETDLKMLTLQTGGKQPWANECQQPPELTGPFTDSLFLSLEEVWLRPHHDDCELLAIELWGNKYLLFSVTMFPVSYYNNHVFLTGLISKASSFRRFLTLFHANKTIPWGPRKILELFVQSSWSKLYFVFPDSFSNYSELLGCLSSKSHAATHNLT